MRLASRHAILTGGSGGIGREIAKGLVKEGAKVTILDVVAPNEDLGAPDALRAVGCDLRSSEDINRGVANAAAAFGPADILIHAAAHQPAYPFEQIPFEGWRKTFEVNVDSFYHLVRAVLPGMKARGWGRILSFTSITFNEGTPEHADYTASKAALIGASRVLAKEFGKFGITVNTLSAGLTKTAVAVRAVEEMVKLGHPNYFEMYIGQQSLKRNLVPQDHVGPVIFLVSDESAAISGQTLIVDGGKMHA